MVSDPPLEATSGVTTGWIRAAGLGLAAALLVLSVGVVYRSTISQAASPPLLQALSCRWQGHRVVISGIVLNPNASSRTITVNKITMRLASGARVELINSYSPSQLDRLAGHGSASWTTSALPDQASALAGRPIAGCTAQVDNWVRGD